MLISMLANTWRWHINKICHDSVMWSKCAWRTSKCKRG